MCQRAPGADHRAEFSTGPDAQLAVYPGEVGLDGFSAHEQLRGNLPVGATGGGEVGDLALGDGQQVGRARSQANPAEFGGTTTRYDYATVAYSAATGAQVWAKRYNSGTGRFDHAKSVAIGSGKVYVTGNSDAAYGSNPDYATVAYSASTGTQLWLRRYNGPGNSTDEATSLAVSPNGARVFVTGASMSGTYANADYATIAYSG